MPAGCRYFIQLSVQKASKTKFAPCLNPILQPSKFMSSNKRCGVQGAFVYKKFANALKINVIA